MTKNLRVLIGIMMFVLAVSLCVSSNASAQGQGQTGPPENSSGGGPIFGNSWYDDGYGSISTEGSIQIGDDDDVCDQDKAGTIRFNTTSMRFEGCDGTAWGVLSLSPIFAIGDTGPAGGIVFYITDGGLHGLEAATGDQSSDAGWGCNFTVTGADGTAVGTGAQNTIDILAGCSEDGTAARVAVDYRGGGYDDWFLPSKDSLNLMYEQREDIGMGAHGYWSSTENNSWRAWAQIFPPHHCCVGLATPSGKVFELKVRAVRAF